MLGNTNVGQCACADTKASAKARKVALTPPDSEFTGRRLSLRRSGARKVVHHGYRNRPSLV
jgi:hypothetical protein